MDETKGKRPTLNQIQSALVDNYQNSRAARVSEYIKAVNGHTALLCKANLPVKIMQEYLLPLIPPDSGLDFFNNIEVGADMLDFMPPPRATLTSTMPYNKEVGIGLAESPLRRAMFALPLIGLFALAATKLDPSNAVPEFISIIESGKINWDSGVQAVFNSFYGVKPLDELAQVTTTFFAGWTLGFDQPGSWQVTTPLADFGTLYAMMLIEYSRGANDLTFAEL